MTQVAGFDRETLVQQLITRSAVEVSADHQTIVADFLALYFARVPGPDLIDTDPNELYGCALSHLESAKKRKSGEVKVRAFNPSVEHDGWVCEHTMVEIISSDMAFLVDSIRMVLNQLGYTIHLTIHPVIGVDRDRQHRINKIKRHNEGLQAESFLSFRIDRELRSEYLRNIETEISEALDAVRAANQDLDPMRNRVLDVAAQVERAIPTSAVESQEEIAALLRWVAENNFTFLGAIQYRQSRRTDSDMQPDESSALGIFKAGLQGDQKNRSQILPDSIADRFLPDESVLITKSSVRSLVHRPAFMDVILIEHPRSANEERLQTLLAGLFSADAYNRSVTEIPILRQKMTRLLDRSGLPARGHGIKVLQNIVEQYPRDDLFQITHDDLYAAGMSMLDLQERQRVRLFVRQDRFDRFYSCLVFVPRERFNSDLREKIGSALQQAFQGTGYEFNVHFSESILARIHFIVDVAETGPATLDTEALEAEIRNLAKFWPDELRLALQEHYGLQAGAEYAERWSSAFPTAYRETFSPKHAATDIQHLDVASRTHQLVIHFSPIPHEERGHLELTIFSPGESVVLSDILPMIENLGLRVLTEAPYVVRCADGAIFFIHVFNLQALSGQSANLQEVQSNIEALLLRVWHKATDNDGFNQLALSAGLDWKQTNLLRAIYRYLKQIRFRYSQEYVIQTLAGNPNMVRRLVRFFEVKFDPDLDGDREAHTKEVRSDLSSGLERVTNIDEDRILSAYINLLDALVRTNYFQKHDPDQAERLAFKIDCRSIARMPEPRPLFEIFVFSSHLEAVHLRSGRVSRGGLRWSDRPEDFRTEVLGLVKAQIVKNAVIVPVGSKGGFIVRKLADCQPSDRSNEVIRCYQTFIRGMLDLTDNRQGDVISPPPQVLRYDGDDPYLVVAADKGTATFSDIANDIAHEYGYWLGDAFASGGKTGYDHKGMGITARGAWESVKRLARDLDLDIQSQPFTVIGIGDMAGDVFGNGMLLSKQIRLVGAFNHQHIFIDPDPDPLASFAERQRLFSMAQSNWADYNQDLLSSGGGVWPRTMKKIDLSDAARKALGISASSLSPEELIHEMLKSPVDLLFNGGIGTYVKASFESHESVGDRANDSLRVDASQLRCRIIGEGGNLGLTQHARIEFSRRGGLCHTDAIDNSAGVDTSDHEVNIKILLNGAVDEGTLTLDERNALLEEMTEEVAGLVLRDNYAQTQALSLATDQAANLIHQHSRAIRQLEQTYGLDRALEGLPDQEQINNRISQKEGLTRPELAVLLSHSKISTFQILLESTVPEDAFLAEDLKRYFPAVLSPRFDRFMATHQLRREIVATYLTNNMINRVGPGFVLRMNELTGALPADTVRAFAAAREIFRLRDCWREIEALDNRVRSQIQKELMHETRQLLEHATVWLLTYRHQPLDIAQSVEEFRGAIDHLKRGFPRVLAASNRLTQKRRVKRYLGAQTPAPLANTVAEFAALSRGLDIVDLANNGETYGIAQVASVYFDVGDRLHLQWLFERIGKLPLQNHWHGLARAALRSNLTLTQRQITARILASDTGRGKSAVRSWIAANGPDHQRLEQMIDDLQKSAELDFAMLAVAVSAAGRLGLQPENERTAAAST